MIWYGHQFCAAVIFRCGVGVGPSVLFVDSHHIHHMGGGVAGVGMHHHHTEHHHHRALDKVTIFPAAMSYAASKAAKSDIATICSKSVEEDIDVSSVI